MTVTFQIFTNFLLKSVHYLQINNRRIGNHLLVLLAFFLPTIESARTSIVFMLIILLFFKQDIWSDLKKILQNRVVQAFILFWLINLILVPFSTDIATSLDYIKKIKFFVVYPLVILLFLDKAFIPRIISAFILGMLISELLSYSIIFQLIDYVPLGMPDAHPGDPSPFLYHMGYGFILAFSATLLLYKTLTIHQFSHRIWYGLFFITVSINVFVNAGRTGYVIYAIAIMALLLQLYKKQFLKITIAGVTFLAIVYTLAFQFSPLFQQRMGLAITSVKNIINDGNLNSNIGYRVAMGTMAIETIKDRPLLGHGPNIASSTISQKARDTNSSIKYLHNIPFIHIDNQYFETLVTLGLIGFAFLINMFIQIARYPQKERELKIIQIVLLVLTLSYGMEATVITDMGFIPKLFVIFTTFTLIDTERLKPLSRLTPIIFFYYSISAISILTISRFT